MVGAETRFKAGLFHLLKVQLFHCASIVCIVHGRPSQAPCTTLAEIADSRLISIRKGENSIGNFSNNRQPGIDDAAASDILADRSRDFAKTLLGFLTRQGDIGALHLPGIFFQQSGEVFRGR